MEVWAEPGGQMKNTAVPTRYRKTHTPDPPSWERALSMAQPVLQQQLHKKHSSASIFISHNYTAWVQFGGKSFSHKFAVHAGWRHSLCVCGLKIDLQMLELAVVKKGISLTGEKWLEQLQWQERGGDSATYRYMFYVRYLLSTSWRHLSASTHIRCVHCIQLTEWATLTDPWPLTPPPPSGAIRGQILAALTSNTNSVIELIKYHPNHYSVTSHVTQGRLSHAVVWPPLRADATTGEERDQAKGTAGRGVKLVLPPAYTHYLNGATELAQLLVFAT